MFVGPHLGSIYNLKDILDYIKFTKKIGGNALQFFMGDNTSTTNASKPKFSNEEFKIIKEQSKNMELYIHASLVLNFCNPMTPRYKWIVDNLIFDMNNGYKMGVKGCVIHFGVIFSDRYKDCKYYEENPIKCGIINFIDSIKYVLSKTPKNMKIYLETSAGQKNKLGSTIEQMGLIYNMINDKKRVKICVDTCHIYVAGYDITIKEEIEDYFKLFNKKIGLKYLELIHLNDSAAEFNSHLDKHENLGYGYIFKDQKILKFLLSKIGNKSIILETRDRNLFKDEIKTVIKYSK